MFLRLKKPWSKPVVRQPRVPETYDPDGPLTRLQWELARELQRGRAANAVAETDIEDGPH